MSLDSAQTGRRASSAQQTINVGTSSTVFLGEAPGRVAIIVSAPNTNRFTLSLTTTAVLDQGITLYAGNQPLILAVADHGDLVTRAWSAISATGAQNVTVIEVFLG